MAIYPPPTTLGAPSRFPAWRDFQDSALYDIADASERFVMAVVPTGAGKSLIYMMLAQLLDVRACVLTRTKNLQRQLHGDFDSMGLRTVQGMNSYLCQAVQPGGELYGPFVELVRNNPTMGCDEGPCRFGARCTLKTGGCDYYDAVRKASSSRLVVTNYTFWLHQHKLARRQDGNGERRQRGLGQFGLLILDEAHEAPEALSEFLTIHLEPWELAKLAIRPLDGTPEPEQWKDWAAFHAEAAEEKAGKLREEIEQLQQSARTVKKPMLEEAKVLDRLATTLKSISEIGEDWVCFWDAQGGGPGRWSFTPKWPAKMAESTLFQGIPKVLLTSATVREKTARYLGIGREKLKVLEYPSTFPAVRRPVVHIQTTKVHHKMTEADTRMWLARIDQLLAQRGDRKGIIHTVSYARARALVQASAHRDRMIVHSAAGTNNAITKFKQAARESGAILVSPSVTTGYDFPYEECEYQIVTKIPFPDSRDPVLQARTNEDPDYPMYLAMQTLVQMAGRGMRAKDDQCETLIIDDNVKWFVWKHKGLAPKWFLDTLKSVALNPAPPPRLQRSGVARTTTRVE